MLLSIVIPAYNEQRTLSRVVERLATIPDSKQTLIVDDCSAVSPKLRNRLGRGIRK